MKKAIPLILALIMCLSLCACAGSVQVTSTPTGQTQNGENSKPENTQSQERWEQMQRATLQYPSSNDEWEYNVYDCYVELTKYLGSETTTLTIPSEIEGLPVWSLNTGGNASNGSTFPGDSIESVTFPDCLMVIGDYAFYHCNLTSISLPDGVQEIGAWSICGDYAEVVIPASVKEIGEGAFVSGHKYSVTVLSPDVDLSYRCFYDANVVYGYAGSTAAQYCVDHADSYKCEFKVIK